MSGEGRDQDSDENGDEDRDHVEARKDLRPDPPPRGDKAKGRGKRATNGES